jgi:hypothetical protein
MHSLRNLVRFSSCVSRVLISAKEGPKFRFQLEARQVRFIGQRWPRLNQALAISSSKQVVKHVSTQPPTFLRQGRNHVALFILVLYIIVCKLSE